MANEEIMEEMENQGTLITLEDEEGNEVEFEFLDIVEHEGSEYIVLIENNENADEVVILKVNSVKTRVLQKRGHAVGLTKNINDQVNQMATQNIHDTALEVCKSPFVALAVVCAHLGIN